MSFEEQRKHLVKSMSLKNEEIEKAFLEVKRENFFPQDYKASSYVDNAFPIGFGQTISQPSTIAIMLEMLDVKEGQKVLEVGSGSGYVAALLSELVGKKGKVFAVELLHELHQTATKILAELGCKNVELSCGDGTLGWGKGEKFDRIIVSAACGKIPKALIEQLNEKGKLLAPVGGRFSQELTLLKKEKGKAFEMAKRCCFVFVPLLGKKARGI